MTQRTDYFDEPDALVTAALLGDFEAAEALIKRDASVNAQDERGRTALMVAIQEDWGGTAWVEFLIANGADVNLLDEDGDSALDLARFHRRSDVADVLLASRAKRKDGPSAKEQTEDEVYRAFEQADAVKRLVAEIEKKKKL